MMKRIVLIMLTLTGSQQVMADLLQTKEGTEDYLAAQSSLENTHRNVRDRDGSTITPEDQLENENDIKITAAIRQNLVKNDSLSVNAQNVKIITRDGNVSLRGTVETGDESNKLQQIAKQTRGVMAVDNQLESKSP